MFVDSLKVEIGHFRETVRQGEARASLTEDFLRQSSRCRLGVHFADQWVRHFFRDREIPGSK